MARKTPTQPFTPDSKPRCAWCLAGGKAPSASMVRYHDETWGVPVHDDGTHFEFMVLDAFQAGLSWAIVLNKREGFRRAFAGFDPVKVARFNRRSVERLVLDEGIVRNRQKIEATISNARAFVRVAEQHGGFDGFIWRFVDGRPLQPGRRPGAALPASSPASEAMSKALVTAGFKFVGATICYAYMQAAGLINDHDAGCFRYAQLGGPDPSAGAGPR